MRSLDLPARPTTRSVRLALAAVALASVALASDLPRAQKNGSGPCADFQSGSGPHPYRRIDGRCEGVYRRPVSSSLELLSLTEGPVRLAPGGWSSLRISWPRLSGQALQLEARVLAPRTLYRMDIAVDRKSQRYVWPLSELRAAGHEHKPIGLRATSAVESAGKTRPVFVPVRAWAPETSPTPAGRDPYHLVLVSGDETLKLFTSLTDRAGGSQALRWRDQEEPAAVWPPDYPIRVQVPRSERGPGFYHLVIKAQGRTSTSSLEIEFPHD